MTKQEVNKFLFSQLERLEDGRHVFITPDDDRWIRALKIAIIELDRSIIKNNNEVIKNYENKTVTCDCSYNFNQSKVICTE